MSLRKIFVMILSLLLPAMAMVNAFDVMRKQFL